MSSNLTTKHVSKQDLMLAITKAVLGMHVYSAFWYKVAEGIWDNLPKQKQEMPDVGY